MLGADHDKQARQDGSIDRCRAQATWWGHGIVSPFGHRPAKTCYGKIVRKRYCAGCALTTMARHSNCC